MLRLPWRLESAARPRLPVRCQSPKSVIQSATRHVYELFSFSRLRARVSRLANTNRLESELRAASPRRGAASSLPARDSGAIGSELEWSWNLGPNCNRTGIASRVALPVRVERNESESKTQLASRELVSARDGIRNERANLESIARHASANNNEQRDSIKATRAPATRLHSSRGSRPVGAS